jgi:hypothetical protein
MAASLVNGGGSFCSAPQRTRPDLQTRVYSFSQFLLFLQPVITQKFADDLPVNAGELGRSYAREPEEK